MLIRMSIVVFAAAVALAACSEGRSEYDRIRTVAINMVRAQLKSSAPVTFRELADSAVYDEPEDAAKWGVKMSAYGHRDCRVVRYDDYAMVDGKFDTFDEQGRALVRHYQVSLSVDSTGAYSGLYHDPDRDVTIN